MTKSKKIIFGAALVLVVVAGLLWFGQHQKPVDNLKTNITCRVAVLIPETGNLSFLGEPVKNALQFALQENRKNLLDEGIKIEFLLVDSKGNPKDAVTVVNRAIDIDGVDVVVSVMSGVTTATAPIVTKKGKFFIGLTVDPSFLNANLKTAIRVLFSYKSQGEEFAKICARRNWTKVLAIYGTDQSSTYGTEKIFIPLMEKSRRTVVRETYSLGQRDFKTLIAKHANFDGQAILIDAFAVEMPLIVSTIRSTPSLKNLPILASLGALEVKPESCAQMVGVEFLGPSFMIKDKDSLFNRLNAEYIKQYPNSTFTFMAVYAYDVFDIISFVLRKSRSTEGRMLFNAIQGADIATVSEIYRFDAKGDFSPAISIGRYDEHGKIVFVGDTE